MPLKHSFNKNRNITSNTIIHGDCIDVMQSIPDESIDLILTDPPYLVNYKDRSGRSILNDKKEGWMKPAFDQMYRTLKQDSFMVCFYGWPKVDRFMEHWQRAGFVPAGHLVWNKRYTTKSRYVAYSHEQAYLLAKGSPPVPDHPMRDVQRWQYSGNGFHPTQKSVAILKPLIESFSKVNDLVLDPFCGSGSTAVAAYRLGRRFIVIEKSGDYFNIARDRLQKINVLHAPEPG